MRRSADRILTTHVGSLPAIDGSCDLHASVESVVRRQREIGLDIINEGEYTKLGDWLSFIEPRFRGFEERPRPADDLPMIARGGASTNRGDRRARGSTP